MAFGVKASSYFVQHFGKYSVRCRTKNARSQFIRCHSVVAEKLVYSEYGDAVKVVRQEKENLPAPKDNEVSTFK
jgi:hypothetical protein